MNNTAPPPPPSRRIGPSTITHERFVVRYAHQITMNTSGQLVSGPTQIFGRRRSLAQDSRANGPVHRALVAVQ